MMWTKLVKVTLKTGKTIEVLPDEVESLKEKGLLVGKELQESQDIKNRF